MGVRDSIHRFELGGRRFAIDPETCFCFECDAVSWDVLEHYPNTPVQRIYRLLGEQYDVKELSEVVGELEWLRACKSILPSYTQEDLHKQFEIDPGIKRMTVWLPEDSDESEPKRRGWFGRSEPQVASDRMERGREAVSLLLGRSLKQRELYLEFVQTGAVMDVATATALLTHALKTAALADKILTVCFRVDGIVLPRLADALRGHVVSAALEIRGTAAGIERPLNAFAKAVASGDAGRLASALQPEREGMQGRIIVCPGHAAFGAVAPALYQEGFTAIELDLDGMYVSHPELAPEAMLPSLTETAMFYAQTLLKGKYFRLDPIATLFWRIYNGTPIRRNDPVGTNELAIGADGMLYPSRYVVANEAFVCGSVTEGTIDAPRLRTFEDVGTLTTAPCITCWARNLCGGGTAAVHHALTGSFRTPSLAWCDAQRAWLAAAVSAFNILSSEGINFTRVYNSLTPSAKPSLFTMVRAAFRLTIGVRPAEESDAEWLVKWENWNDAAYFTYTEGGVLVGTKYDREMDALHPTGVAQEMILTKKDGAPFGLIRLQPDRLEGVMRAWVYIRRETDCADDSVRKGFRGLLKEALGHQQVRKVLVTVSEQEIPLRSFLEAVGFTLAGVEREGLYLHRRYFNVYHFEAAVEEL